MASSPHGAPSGGCDEGAPTGAAVRDGREALAGEILLPQVLRHPEVVQEQPPAAVALRGVRHALGSNIPDIWCGSVHQMPTPNTKDRQPENGERPINSL